MHVRQPIHTTRLVNVLLKWTLAFSIEAGCRPKATNRPFLRIAIAIQLGFNVQPSALKATP